jgi:glycosyltransferase involved in cell wall biosynthesis
MKEPDMVALKRVSVIMPALNEAECIQATVSSIPIAEFRRRGFDAEIIVVDNGSTDNSVELARQTGARVVVEPLRGYGNAYLRGFREAEGDIICTLDADGTYPSDVLPALADKLVKEELDFISTNRFAFMYNGVMTRTNKIGNAILNATGRLLFRLPFADSQSGMWCFRKEILSRMNLRSTGMALSEEIKIEAAWRLRLRCAEVPIHYKKRTNASKLNVWRDGMVNLAYLVGKRLD